MEISLESVVFDKDGLIPVIVQDKWTSEVLMMAYANEEAIEKTMGTGELHFFSRSRKCLWHKGETSGNRMMLQDLMLDCDGDTLLAKVNPMGPACHTGNRSCFFRNIKNSEKTPDLAFLARLWDYLKVRGAASPTESYTARLLHEGRDRVGQKVGEEGVETAIAIATGNRDQVAYETADLIYHSFVGLISMDVEFREIISELIRRHKQ